LWAHFGYDPDRRIVPVFPDQLHAFIGRAIWIAAIYNCFTGIPMILDDLDDKEQAQALQWVVALFSLFVSGLVAFWWQSSLPKQSHPHLALVNQ
jgi:hypothetical protein